MCSVYCYTVMGLFLVLVFIASRGENTTASGAPAMKTDTIGPKPETKRTISKLSLEVLLQISTFFPPASKASPALSCKALYAVYSPALKALDLRFPTSFQPPIGCRAQSHYFSTQRWQLLLYLEDDRWRPCSRCLTLHRVTEYSHISLMTLPDERICRFGKDAGVVEICPCIKMTYIDKLKLVDELLLNEKRPRGIADIDYSDGSLHMWHCCEMKGNQLITTKIFPVLEENGHVRIVTTYDVRETLSPAALGGLTPAVLCCPHLSVCTYIAELRRAKRTANSPFTVRYKMAANMIIFFWCALLVRDFKGEITDSGRFIRSSFKTVRGLGQSTSRPEHDWFLQTTYSQDPPIDKEKLDMSPFLGLARFRRDLFPTLTLQDLRDRMFSG